MPNVAQIPLDKAYLTAIWLETLFYGINIVLFFSYLVIAKLKRRTPRVTKGIMAIAILMFCFSTIHVSLGFQRLIEGFIVLRNTEAGPAGFFSDVSIPANVAKVIIHTVNSILGDSIVVWRCYHVWGESWQICVIPILFIIASAVCGFGQGVIFAKAKDTHSAFNSELQKWNGSLFTLSLVTNLVVTSLIAARIIYLGRQFGTQFQYKRVLVIVVESGAIYSSALIIEITLYFLNTNAFYIVYDPIAQLTAIVPTMIIVMSSLGMTSSDMDEESRNRMTVESTPQFAAPAGRRRIGPLSFSTSEGTTTTELDGKKD